MLQVGEWSAEHRLGRRRPGRLRRASPKGSRSAKENPGAWAPGRLVETGSVRLRRARRTSCGFDVPHTVPLAAAPHQASRGSSPSGQGLPQRAGGNRSEEHTSELQSLMRISYAVFCLKKKNKQQTTLANIDK